MGIYVFHTKFLMDILRRDAADPKSSRDFGKDIIPISSSTEGDRPSLTSSCVRSISSARPIGAMSGTIDAYWQANIDLTHITPELDIYDSTWPIWTFAEIKPPAKFVHDDDDRRGSAVSSLVSGDCIISGASLNRSLLFTGVRVNSYSRVENSVVLPNVKIGRHAQLSNVVIDARVVIPRAGGRRGSGAGRQALPPLRRRHLPDYPADDRPADALTPDKLAGPADAGPPACFAQLPPPLPCRRVDDVRPSSLVAPRRDGDASLPPRLAHPLSSSVHVKLIQKHPKTSGGGPAVAAEAAAGRVIRLSPGYPAADRDAGLPNEQQGHSGHAGSFRCLRSPSADQDRGLADVARRAAGGGGRAWGDHAHADAGLSRRSRQAGPRRRKCMCSTRCSGHPGRILSARHHGLDLLLVRLPRLVRPAGRALSRCERQGSSGQFPPLRRALACRRPDRRGLPSRTGAGSGPCA